MATLAGKVAVVMKEEKHGCSEEGEGRWISQGVDAWQTRQGSSRECKFDRLQAFEPLRKVRSEAGVTEYFDETSEQFQCVGMFVIRRVIEPQGLVVPRYSNTPALAYIIQGKGYFGLTFPGCPATHQQQFQQFDQSQSTQGQKFRDEHQKIHQFRQGDVVALPAGVAHWFYNGGDTQVVVVYVYDIKNFANQLEPRQKEFLLAGNNQRGQQTFEQSYLQHSEQNIFNGFNVEVLGEAIGINTETTRRLQSQNDQRGEIIRVKHGLQLLKPTLTQQQEQQEQQYSKGQYNGLEENFCTVKARVNIESPTHADYYNPRAGRITRLDNQKLPILNLVGMSAARVNLYQNALLSPFWNIYGHSVVYMIHGSARVQVVNNQGRSVFNGVLRNGQVLIIPQNHAIIKKAERNGCQYITIKTSPNSMVSQVTGKNSILRALPVDVIANAYRISRDEARRLKDNRADEIGAFTPRLHPRSQRGYQFLAEGLSLIGMLTAGATGVEDDGDDYDVGGYGVLDGACGGTVAVFCVLAVSVVVWNACAFVAMAAALLAVAWRVVAPRRVGAASPAIDAALPTSTYERRHGGGGEAVCSVCLEDVRGGETVRRMPACGHMYHAACIEAWLRSHTTCPLCRADVSPRRAPSSASSGVDADGGGGGDNDADGFRVFYGIAVVCLSIFLFCVLAASVSVWKACAYAAMAALVLSVAGFFAPKRWIARRSSRRGSTTEADLAGDRHRLPTANVLIARAPAFVYEGGDDGGKSCVVVCSVCLEDVTGGETVRRLPACRHVFHVGCINMWLHSHRTCPMCRCVVSPAAAAAEEVSPELSPTLRGVGESGRGCRACFGIAALCVSVVLFCVLAVVGSVWKASMFAGLVLLAFGVADCLVPASWRGGGTRATEREAAAAARSISLGLDKESMDTLPTFAYLSGSGGGGGGDLEAGKGDGEPCSVCLEELHAGETVRQLPACGHVYHVECIDMWLHSHRTCPMCRCDLSPARELAAKEEAAAELPADDALPPSLSRALPVPNPTDPLTMALSPTPLSIRPHAPNLFLSRRTALSHGDHGERNSTVTAVDCYY
uniref:RING-type domain-containing protein n=1 Tax=Leersia perrieri TaxID=77586 RepID=A0A0D9VE98_9ORYZ